MKPGALGGLVLAVALGACSAADDTADTLPPVGSAAQVTGGTAPGSVPAGPVGSGVVRVDVRLSALGVEEELLLDRATVAQDQLDPISLDATCTALDGGTGMTVTIVDLRRLGDGQRLVSVTLQVDGDVTTPGEYEGSMEIGDADQRTTRYDGTVVVDAGLSTGTFDLADGDGGAATGSFACAPDATSLPTTTTTPPPVADTSGGSLPLTVPVSTSPSVSVSVSVPSTTAPLMVPAATVPVATS